MFTLGAFLTQAYNESSTVGGEKVSTCTSSLRTQEQRKCNSLRPFLAVNVKVCFYNV